MGSAEWSNSNCHFLEKKNSCATFDKKKTHKTFKIFIWNLTTFDFRAVLYKHVFYLVFI